MRDRAMVRQEKVAFYAAKARYDVQGGMVHEVVQGHPHQVCFELATNSGGSMNESMLDAV
jgi:hypothetical protein